MVIKYPTIIRTLFTLLRDAGHMASPKAAHWHPLLGMCDTEPQPLPTMEKSENTRAAYCFII